VCSLQPGVCSLSHGMHTVPATLVLCDHAYSRHAAATCEADQPLPVQIPKSEQKARKKDITVG